VSAGPAGELQPDSSTVLPDGKAKDVAVKPRGRIKTAANKPPIPHARRYRASIHPSGRLPKEFVEIILELERHLGKPVWLLVQDHKGPFGHIEEQVPDAFIQAKDQLKPGEHVALLVHSDGGYAREAYRLARLLQRRCGGFDALVPKGAMSAATLLVLGGDSLLLGEDAELGPLDAQRWDPEAERHQSVLNEIQSLERLRAYSLDSIAEVLAFLSDITLKRYETLLPHTLRFVGDTLEPLLQKIDVVHYTESSRILKVAEEYAIRLLSPRLGPSRAQNIASKLVQDYPEHDFPIYIEEARSFGLPIADPSDEVAALLGRLWPIIEGVAAIGRIEEDT
jgi:hypothetical protein